MHLRPDRIVSSRGNPLFAHLTIMSRIALAAASLRNTQIRVNGTRAIPVRCSAVSEIESAFEQLVRTHRRQVLSLAWRLTGNAADAEDIAQEVFLRLHQSPVAAEDAGRWLRRVVVNLCIDSARRNGRVVPMPDREFVSSAEPPDKAVGRAEEHERLRIALQRLSERERAALVLRDIEGLTTAEVAATMSTAEPTVRVQIARARLKLREMLRGMR
jgi:RNA polymerase sigma-70 factor (ECF subfamily)